MVPVEWDCPACGSHFVFPVKPGTGFPLCCFSLSMQHFTGLTPIFFPMPDSDPTEDWKSGRKRDEE